MLMRQLFWLDAIFCGGCPISPKNRTSSPQKTGAAPYRGGSYFFLLLNILNFRCIETSLAKGDANKLLWALSATKSANFEVIWP